MCCGVVCNGIFQKDGERMTGGFNTSKKWDDMSNYDMVLDSSRIGIDGCTRAIEALLK